MTPENVQWMENDVDQEAQPNDRVMKEWRIILLGKSGAGKSASGNTILGRREAFKSDMRLARVTQYCVKEQGIIDGRPISVIDTPGLFETDRKEEVIVREILKCVKLQGLGPHVFVLVVPVGRFTMEDQETNKLIEAMFGPRVWDYTILLFTHGDRMEGKTLNEIIANSDENLRRFIRKCSGGFLVFNNKDIDNQEQVAKLLEKVEILVAINGEGHYRTAFYPAQERKIREEQERILAEKDTEIAQKERQLKDKYEGEELEKKRRELWRKEEEEARKKAEKSSQYSRKFQVFTFIFAIVIGELVVGCGVGANVGIGGVIGGLMRGLIGAIYILYLHLKGKQSLHRVKGVKAE